ncbi:hypothetical protein Poly51_24760 [Rubripirellula tenax]|uniref:DUF374 domain-containing protein n=1 Tax=Rubripirellula tenax TaxID=2528015 RepID=A0A5C6F7J8_9BACT|nr:lysophospholipid acyltransferase family protein [Rubripirellula tenax]TWU56560.1 hypothetical protein Poly51_24760 [Rubripirellula tenax]
MKRLIPWLVGFAIYGIRMTCRVRIHNDPRGRIRRQSGLCYVFAQLHAHQVAAGMFGDVGTGAMVSRSADAEMIVPALRLLGKTPVRGSSGKSQKGGATALHALVRHIEKGFPAVIAVDGPRGPRGLARPGAGFLAQKTTAPVLPVIAIPTRRWVLNRTWDRMQIPKPFSTVDIYFGEPIFVGQDDDTEAIATRVGTSLHELEFTHDSAERPVAPTPEFTTQIDLNAIKSDTFPRRAA